jgi:hypothetical protein
MRVFELTAHIKTFGRSKGASATAAAAYRACCVIDCEREGRTHDYTRKQGLEASEIVTPRTAPAWASDRKKLWNAAELRERNGKRGKNAGAFKADAVTAREFMFNFPSELSAAGRLKVARAIAQHLVDTHGTVADFSIHEPGRDGDERNYHCHMLTTTRRMTAVGLGQKVREWADFKRGSDLTRQFRALLAQTLNAALADEGKAGVHVEHRSFKDRGILQRPTRHIGPVMTAAFRKERKQTRDNWHRTNRKQQADRHGKERIAQKTKQDFALAAKLGDIAERERRGIAAIRDELAKAQAADTRPQGATRLFQQVTGRAMRAEFEREARHAARAADAERRITELKTNIQAERSAYARAQTGEATALTDRHKAEDHHLQRAFAARATQDRIAEVEMRREPGRAFERANDREHERSRDDQGRRRGGDDTPGGSPTVH